MSALLNSLFGIIFLGVAIALTFLMFYLWKFPYDKEAHRSSAPRSLTAIHRILGYVYVLLYIYLMWQMVPRLWTYQIELPARTVFHLTIGMSIGAILIVKIAIVRYFKHLEAKLVPFLGCALLICTMLLISLALPFSLREAYLSVTALDGDDSMTSERIERVREQLPQAGIEDIDIIDQLATRQSLEKGRNVLQTKCTQCHDLRTALARPRTPESWRQTVSRMANRSTILNPISDQDQLEVTAYLIAISPTLQKTLAEKRKQALVSASIQMDSMKMSKKLMDLSVQEMVVDPEQAKQVFEQRCSQCHAYTHIERVPPGSKEEVIMLVQRMIGNGLIVNDDELVNIISHISSTYLKPNTQASRTEVKSQSASTTTENTLENNLAALDGARLFEQRACASCHGPAGRAPIAPNYPNLASQSKGYMIKQIQDIRSGERANGLSAVMQGVVSDITDEEIKAIASYLSKLNR